MSDDELTNLIRERQRRAECEAAGITYVPDALAVRKAPHCDPETGGTSDDLEAVGTPDVLLEPNPQPPDPVPDRVLPPPLIIRSPAVTVNCSNHGGGVGSATSELGESSVELYLDDVPEITRSELYRVAGNHAALQDALDANVELLVSGGITSAAFDAIIIAASTLEATAAAGIRVAVKRLRGGPTTGLYALAELTAMSRLVCTFESEALWVVCDSESDAGFTSYPTAPDPLPSVDRYRTRPAGFRTSTVSLADANELAALDAVVDPTFVCVYVSAPVTVTCAEDVDDIYDHPYAPAFEWEGESYDSLAALGAAGFSSYALDSLSLPRALVYTHTLAGGLYPSATQADADAKARAAAIRQLNCFFPSRAAVIDCENRSISNPVTIRIAEVKAENPGMTDQQAKDFVFHEMDEEYSGEPGADLGSVTNVGLILADPGPGADLDVSEGLRVTIPAGLVATPTSQDDADDEARLHALGFLACRWVSAATTCSCTDIWGTAETVLEDYNAVLNVASSTVTLTFEKGALGFSEDEPFNSGDSFDLCKASLNCIYCNQTIDPRCTIAFYEGNPIGYDLWDRLPTPDSDLPISLVTPEGEPLPVGVSLGISAGLPSNVICDSDPRLVNTLAVATASLPPMVNNAVGDPVCHYGNRELTLSCMEKANAGLPGDKSFGLTPESQLRVMTVAAGSFTAPTQPAADALAEAFLNAALVCEYGNPPLIVLCGAVSSSEPITEADYTTTATYGTGRNVSEGSTGGVTTPLTAAAHTFTSLDSPAVARAQALLSLISQLDCFYSSARVEVMCGAPPLCPVEQRSLSENMTIISGANEGGYSMASIGNSPGEVFLAAREITSYVSQEDANVKAYDIARSQLDCFWHSAKVNLRCTAETDCPQAFWSYTEFMEIRHGDIVIGPPREPLGNSTFSQQSTGYNWDDVVVDERTIASYISQKDANEQAYKIAWSELDCFFRSAQVMLSCVPARFPSSFELLLPEGGTIIGGSEPDVMTTEPGAITSYHNQSNANSQAYQITRAALACDGGKDHAFGLSGYGTFKCCKVKFSDLMLDAGQSVLYSPLPSGTGLTEVIPGYEKIIPGFDDAEVCGDFPAFFYLEALLHKREDGDTYARYYTTECNVEVYDTEQPSLEGADPYTLVRRLIAHVDQPDASSSLNRGSKDDCAGLKIVQLVTAPQKLSSSSMGGTIVPTITDVDSPAGGGGEAAAGGCDNLRLYTADDGGTLYLRHKPGSVGNESYADSVLGTLAANYDKYLYAKFTLAGSSYTTSLEMLSTTPGSTDSVVYVMLGSVGPSGELSKQVCAAYATVCRNWYAGEAPYYSMTVSYG